MGISDGADGWQGAMINQDRRYALAALAVLAGYLVVLGIVPYWAPPEADLPNVAARLGYNVSLAYTLTLAWTALCGLALVAVAFFGVLRAPESAGQGSPSLAERPGRLLLEAGLLVAIVFFAHFPPFLARVMEFIEDDYFLHALFRMQCGDLPYRDFEYLYGPLSIVPAHWWMNLFGYSGQSYYALVAVLQASFFGLLYLVISRYGLPRLYRYAAFLLLVPFLLDFLLGLNYVPWRRMLPIFGIMIVAAAPLRPGAIAAAAGVFALAFAYSFEFAAMGLAASGVIYALMFFSHPFRQVLVHGLSLAGASLGLGLALVWLLTGSAFTAYIGSTLEVVRSAAELGLGAFAFHWTAHSVSGFALLAVTLTILAVGLPRLAGARMGEGDRLLLACALYTLLTLKIALQRADIWHTSAPFLAIALAWILPAERRLFAAPRSTRPVAIGLILVLGVTTLIGYLPMGVHYLQVYRRGAIDVVSGQPTVGEIHARRPALLSERTILNTDSAEVAAWLAAEGRRERPVLFYQTWEFAPHIGVCPVGYSFYDLLYTDRLAPMRALLERTPDALVVMRPRSYAYLFEGVPSPPREREMRLRERLGAVLATVHYHQSPLEGQIEDRMWRDAVGLYIAEHYREAARVGDVVILTRKDRPGD